VLSKRNASPKLLFVNDRLASWLRDRFNYSPPRDLSFDDILTHFVDLLRKYTPIQDTSFSYEDLKMLASKLKSQGWLGDHEKLDNFEFGWIKMTDTFSVSRSLKTDDPHYPQSQPHCRFLCHKEGTATRISSYGQSIHPAHSVLLVGAAAQLIPRKSSGNILPRSADHHIEYVIDKLSEGKWASATRDFVETMTYHLGYPKQFVDTIAEVETVFRVIHRGTCAELYGRDWSLVLGLPLYIAEKQK